MNAKLILVASLGVAALTVPRSANGQNGAYGWPCAPYCWSYGYANSSVSDVPYFSLYPPVYYSYRVARIYGYSPFAYPPGVMTPGSEPARPIVIQSSYAPGEAIETPEGRASGPQPLRIDNPFVEQSQRAGVMKSRATPAPIRRWSFQPPWPAPGKRGRVLKIALDTGSENATLSALVVVVCPWFAGGRSPSTDLPGRTESAP